MDLSAQAAEESAVPDRPNIVVILTDDAGFSDIGSFGGEIDTPHIDALARDGMRFTRFYANARCSPTRASLLTGRYPASVGFGAGTLADPESELPLDAYRARLSSAVPTLAEILSANGYATYMAGKWHLGGNHWPNSDKHRAHWQARHPGWDDALAEVRADNEGIPTARGFDDFFGTLRGETPQFLQPGSERFYLRGDESLPVEATGTYDVTSLLVGEWQNEETVDDGTRGQSVFYGIDGVTDAAISMLEEQRTADPFFLYLAYQAPHRPLEAPTALVEKYLQRYQSIEESRRSRAERLIDRGVFEFTEADALRRAADRSLDGPQDWRRRLAVHAAMLEVVDDGVGRVVAALRAANQLDNTLLFFLSDNGAALQVRPVPNTPFRGSKGLLWEGGIRTHAIVHWPARIEGASTNGTLGWVGDLLPTILDAVDVAYPQQWGGAPLAAPDGRSLLPALDGLTMPAPETLFFADRNQTAVIWKGEWKLLLNPGWYRSTRDNKEPATELYEYWSDPLELESRVDDYPRLVEYLSDLATSWRREQQLIDEGDVRALKNTYTGSAE